MIRKPVKITSIKICVFFVSIQRENVIFSRCDVSEIESAICPRYRSSEQMLLASVFRRRHHKGPYRPVIRASHGPGYRASIPLQYNLDTAAASCYRERRTVQFLSFLIDMRGGVMVSR